MLIVTVREVYVCQIFHAFVLESGKLIVFLLVMNCCNGGKFHIQFFRVKIS